MRVSHLLSPALLLLSMPAFGLITVHPSHSAAHAKTQHSSLKSTMHGTSTHSAVHATAHHESPVSMPAERATAIQAALIQKGYLSGEPSGTWDAQTASAMVKLQSDNGWQTHNTPDARALIKLGLGPSETPPSKQTPRGAP